MPYEKWFDDYATVFELQPGEMVTWPLYAPHRVLNHDCLNISVTMEHWTKQIWNSYAVHYGNGVLRRTLGLKNPSTVDHGLHVYPEGGRCAPVEEARQADQRRCGQEARFPHRRQRQARTRQHPLSASGKDREMLVCRPDIVSTGRRCRHRAGFRLPVGRVPRFLQSRPRHRLPGAALDGYDPSPAGAGPACETAHDDRAQPQRRHVGRGRSSRAPARQRRQHSAPADFGVCDYNSVVGDRKTLAMIAGDSVLVGASTPVSTAATC